jgi:ribosomal protein S12 methylthiotransferase accessory factor
MMSRDGGAGRLLLLGEGRLHDAIAERLAPAWNLTDGEVAALVVSAADTAARAEALEEAAARHRLPRLAVHGELDRVVVGPTLSPGDLGCPRCLARRRGDAAADSPSRAALALLEAPLASAVSPLLGALATGCVAALVEQEVEATRRGEPLATRRAALFVQLDTLESRRHRFLPDPHCRRCGTGLPPDDARWARLALRPRAPHRPGAKRVRDLGTLEPLLTALYVDEEAGLLAPPRPSGDLSFPFVRTRLRRGPGRSGEGGYGRTSDFRSARLTALTEALERMGGLRPGHRRTVVRGSYRALGARALDPRTLGVYPPERHAREAIALPLYSEDLEIGWVWGHSFRRGEPVLVPECCAYYRLPEESRRDRFVYEISNGCALGSCPEEAILHGLLELAERDAFLLTWLAQLPIPRLDPRSASDARIPSMIERIRRRTGYRVQLHASTLDILVPCFWAMARDERDDAQRPRVLCAAGSSLDPESGVLGALQELSSCLEWRLASYPRERERAAQLAADFSRVESMDDHALLYCHPDAAGRLDFLSSDPAPPISFAELGRRCGWPEATSDLTADLREMLARFLARCHDVVVVDQSTPEHHAGGFTCVKVLAPGTLPMTFGHRLRRVEGLPRLLEVPHELGYRPRPLSQAELNPAPHPFP